MPGRQKSGRRNSGNNETDGNGRTWNIETRNIETRNVETWNVDVETWNNIEARTAKAPNIKTGSGGKGRHYEIWNTIIRHT